MSITVGRSPVWISADDVGVAFDNVAPQTASVPLKSLDVLILVGFTGAGKSTTLHRLAERGVVSGILPDRRELTDKVILPAMTGSPSRKVTDRLERFALTAAFRKKHSGGMGDVLERLMVPAKVPDGLIAFDGLRGRAEVEAVLQIPQARFLYLKASADVRLARLCVRDDPFDRNTSEIREAASRVMTNSQNRFLDILKASGMSALLPEYALTSLAGWLACQTVDPEMATTAASIVVEESKHYPAEELTIALNNLAPNRALVLDSGTLSPDAIVDQVLENGTVALTRIG